MGGRSQSPSLLDESVRAADRSPLPSLPLHMRARVHVRVLMRLVTKASTLGVVPAGVSTGKSRRVGRLGDVKEVQIFVSRVRGRVSGGSTRTEGSVGAMVRAMELDARRAHPPL